MIIVLFLTVVTWITYGYVVARGGFVSDDFEGLIDYKGKLQGYDYCAITKWLLYKLFNKWPKSNHFFSVLIHNANVVFLYYLLSTFIPQNIAISACVLFAIHPVNTQAIAWISGRGYPISLLYCLMSFNLIIRYPITDITSLISIGLILIYSILYYIAVHSQFAAMMTFAVHLWLGNYFLAFIGAAITLLHLRGIIPEVITKRKKVFADQNLQRSTFFHLRKLSVVFKTLAYYTLLSFFPKRMGLYHKFHYDYDDKTEKVDGMVWLGIVIFAVSITGFLFGNVAVQFGLVWYYAYLFIFFNWITVHQFVSDRYLYIPIIGICVLLAQGLSYIPALFPLVVGFYLMRTWVHLPTYCDEVAFYQSNVWNFPTSEVAFANLGVTYMKCQLIGSAVDMWLISTKINPDYDVSWYNLASVMKQRNQLVQARDYLKKAVDSKTCHFKEIWTKELHALDHELNYAEQVKKISVQLDSLAKNPTKKDQAQTLQNQLNEINFLHKRFNDKREKNLQLVQQEQSQLSVKMIQLNNVKLSLEKPVLITDLVRMRDENFKVFKENLAKAI